MSRFLLEVIPEWSLRSGELWDEISAGEFALIIEHEDDLKRFGYKRASGNVRFYGDHGVFIAVIASGKELNIFAEARVAYAVRIEELIHSFGRVAELHVMVDEVLNRLDFCGRGIARKKSKRPPIPMPPT